MDNKRLEVIATELRISVMEMLKSAKSGHAAGPLGLADLFTILYFEMLKHDPSKSIQDQEDFLLVSNGHIAPIWYATLAKSGYFSPEELNKLRKIDSFLEGHPKFGKIPGVFNSSGPLAHGQGQAIGLAMGLKNDNKNTNRVFLVCSDGEHQEGAVWESMLVAAKYKLNNLTYLLDLNNIQIDGFVNEIMPLPNLANIYSEIGWQVEICNAHNFDSIRECLNNTTPNINPDKPKLIILNSVAGKGVSFMENDYNYHDWKNDPDKSDKAINELEEKLATIK